MPNSFTFHDIYVRKDSTDPEHLVKQIMGYEQSDLSHVPAIKWGLQYEHVARQQYTNLMYAQHEGFACSMTGLWVSPRYPHLGVSPDGFPTCICCEKAFKRLSVHFQLNRSSINCKTCNFLTDSGYLNRNYTQVQGQLLFTGQLFCDFYLDSIKSQTGANIS